MPRTPKQDRSRAAKEAITLAALELLGELGPQAVTQKSVATRAGLPAASIGYYFPVQAELLDEAFTLYFTRRIDYVIETFSPPEGEPIDAEKLSSLLAVDASGRSATFLLPFYETYVLLLRHGDTYPNSLAVLKDAPKRIAVGLAAAGVGVPLDFAEAMIAVVEGFAFRRILYAAEPGDDQKVFCDTVRAIIESYI